MRQGDGYPRACGSLTNPALKSCRTFSLATQSSTGGLGSFSSSIAGQSQFTQFPRSFLDEFLGVEILFHGVLCLGYLLGPAQNPPGAPPLLSFCVKQ
jgi:hypothetical protein